MTRTICGGIGGAIGSVAMNFIILISSLLVTLPYYHSTCDGFVHLAATATKTTTTTTTTTTTPPERYFDATTAIAISLRVDHGRGGDGIVAHDANDEKNDRDDAAPSQHSRQSARRGDVLDGGNSDSSSRRAFLSRSASSVATATLASTMTMNEAPANADGLSPLSTSPAATPSASSSAGTGNALKLPPIGLGCWSWGDSLFWGYDPRNDDDLRSVFEYATSRHAPVLFDSAELYGLGRSETLLGTYSRSLQHPDDVVIATKFAPYPWRTKSGSVVAACEASAKRLGTGRPIDLYQIHFPNAYANEAYWDGIADAYEEGLIRAVGVSNYGVDAVRACHAALARRGVPLSTNQIQFSLLYQHPEKSNGLLRCCEDLGMDVLSYSPLALGLLTGKYANADDVRAVSGPRRALFEKNVADPQFSEILRAMTDVADGHVDSDATVAQVAINWCIAKGTIPIPGARTLRQVKSNYGSLDWKMNDEEVKFLDKISRGYSYIDVGASPFPRVDKDTGLVMFDS